MDALLAELFREAMDPPVRPDDSTARILRDLWLGGMPLPRAAVAAGLTSHAAETDASEPRAASRRARPPARDERTHSGVAPARSGWRRPPGPRQFRRGALPAGVGASLHQRARRRGGPPVRSVDPSGRPQPAQLRAAPPRPTRTARLRHPSLLGPRSARYRWGIEHNLGAVVPRLRSTLEPMCRVRSAADHRSRQAATG